MTSWAQARAFTWLHLAALAAALAAMLFGELLIGVLLFGLSAAIQIAALALCRCPRCGKPPHWRGSPNDWMDWFRPWMRLWPEEVCSRCRANLAAD